MNEWWDIKKDIKHLIEQETPNLNNLLSPEEVSDFKSMTEELRDTWTKKQMFRTETEMEFSVLNDAKYPTNAAKYWQCVREQNVFLENLMSLSFDYRRNEIKIKRLQQKMELQAAKDYQLKLKAERLEEERRMEQEFKIKMAEKFAEDERLE